MASKISLGIESTAHTLGVGIIDEKGNILANVKKQYVNNQGGGIKPYDVSQHHYSCMVGVLKQALNEASLNIKDIDVISFSQGPGLGPCLSVSATAARALSLKYKKPLVGVNHCVAHIEIAKTLLMMKDPLIIFTSGANTQIIVKDENRYKILGETLDIGIGNLFDSFARDLGYGFPGGPILDKIYFEADREKYIDLPYSVKGMDVAFSGLLTSARKLISKEDNKQLIYSFMHTAYAMLIEVVDRSLSYTKKKEVVVIGGVAASKALKEMLEIFAKQHNITLHIPPMVVCLDNGLIIADLGLKKYLHQGSQKLEDTKINPKFRTDEPIINW
jgi:N6-L-threonylcarbamoyladenine synthase